MSPLLLKELVDSEGYASVSEKRGFFLQYGLYPLVFDPLASSVPDIQENLSTLAGALLYKDILELETIRKSPIISDLLTLVALQVGSEVSYSELAQKIGVNIATVQKYLYLLEEAFIIFTLRAFSRNLRNEIHKSQKIYFYDVGIRNALIRNFNPPEIRTDLGGLWENFVIAERVKYNKSSKYLANGYFWRTHEGKEIDYLEEKDGMLQAFEIKWNEKKQTKMPKVFQDAYPNTPFRTIHGGNWIDFCGMR
jgi:predicted AAA+ superfamily ATPase